jgi:hypothetical protein
MRAAFGSYAADAWLPEIEIPRNTIDAANT